MRLWISKDALSVGHVYAVDGEALESTRLFIGPRLRVYRLGVDAHETREEAIRAAESKRDQEIALYEKRIEKLRGMSYG